MTDTGVDASCLVAYNSFKQNRDKRYIIFRANDYDQVVVASEGGRDKTYTDFMDAIADEREPGYGVVDFKPEGSEEEKTLLLLWIPDSSIMKKRMLLGSLKQTMQRYFEGIHRVIITRDLSELVPESVSRQLQQC
ncbi:cofilin [Perkinsus olseni]|uniref:Cofilin n=1 Tax=Perkinsus olseni TaxID=32597 RepID=A0A7J6T4Q5_PEROL|nr:cofilin [Perkinsus olseni]